MRVFSYVVVSDSGFAPNPFHGVCTLACCKPVIRRHAQVGDLIVGLSTRCERVVYAMKVSRVLGFDEYWRDAQGLAKRPDRSSSAARDRRGDNIYEPLPDGGVRQLPSQHSARDVQRDLGGQRVLFGDPFCYFGEDGPPLPSDLGFLRVKRSAAQDRDPVASGLARGSRRTRELRVLGHRFGRHPRSGSRQRSRRHRAVAGPGGVASPPQAGIDDLLRAGPGDHFGQQQRPQPIRVFVYQIAARTADGPSPIAFLNSERTTCTSACAIPRSSSARKCRCSVTTLMPFPDLCPGISVAMSLCRNPRPASCSTSRRSLSLGRKDGLPGRGPGLLQKLAASSRHHLDAG